MIRVSLNKLFGLSVVVVLMAAPAPGVRSEAMTSTPTFNPSAFNLDSAEKTTPCMGEVPDIGSGDPRCPYIVVSAGPLTRFFSGVSLQPSTLQQTRDVTLAELGYETDETVHGVRVTRDFSVNWPDAWAVQPGNTFSLHFSHSPALDPRSSLTVEFNGARLTSVLLTQENAQGGQLQVALPGSLIDVGHNQLRLEFYMGLNDFNCGDLDDPAVWATIHNTSAFHFSYSLKSPEINLADFPAPFIDNSQLVENHVTFILPDEPTPAELNAAVAISAKLGQLAAWRTLHLHTLSETQARDAEAVQGDVIIVGRADRLRALRVATPPFVSWKGGRPVLADGQGEPVPPEAGMLWEQPSPSDETAVMLIVTGATDKAVLTAARALASEASYPRLAGQLGIVLSVPEPPPVSEAIGQVVTLEELGYADRTAWGTREQSIAYTVPLPLAWQIQSEATLDLHFAHSAIADPKRSFLNVLLNGTPVGSIHLTPENVLEGHTTFQLPARLFQPGDNTLTVMSDMKLDADQGERLDCLEPDPKEAWLVVYADSQLHLPGGPAGVALDLADYPPAFIGLANLSDLVFVVPESVDITIARALIQLAERIGHFAEGETLAPQVIDAQTLELMDPPSGPQILVGRPTRNAAITQLNSVLPQPFKSGADDPEPVESMAQIVPLEGTVGYIQAVLGAEGQPRLVVTGTDDEGVLWASEVLSDPALVRRLAGDLVIVGSKGSMAAIGVRSQEDRRLPQPPITGGSVASTPRSIGWVKGLTAGLFILTFAVLAIVVWPGAHRDWKARGRHEA